MQPTILIVDDEKHTREGLRASLEDSFDVYVAADIASAMNVLDNERVDLVLTDLRLGGDRGPIFAAKLVPKKGACPRRLPPAPGPPTSPPRHAYSSARAT